MHNFSNKLHYPQPRGEVTSLPLGGNELWETGAIILRRNDSVSILICSGATMYTFSSTIEKEALT